MELEKVNLKTKCDIPNCNNYASYTLKLRKFWNIGNTNFCKSCLQKMHIEVGKVFTPKSPDNMLKKPKKLSEDK
jgi:transcription elongation factor Elf1